MIYDQEYLKRHVFQRTKFQQQCLYELQKNHRVITEFNTYTDEIYDRLIKDKLNWIPDLTDEQIQQYFSARHTPDEIFEIFYGHLIGLPLEKIDFYAKKRNTVGMMRKLRLVFETTNIPVEEALGYLNPFDSSEHYNREYLNHYVMEFTNFQQKCLWEIKRNHSMVTEFQFFFDQTYERLMANKLNWIPDLTDEQIHRYFTAGFSDEQLFEVLYGHVIGLPLEKIDFYAKQQLPAFVMQNYRINFETSDIPVSEARKCRKNQKRFSLHSDRFNYQTC